MPRNSIRKSDGKTTPIGNTTSCDYYNGLASKRTLCVLTKVDNRWDENREWRIACVTTTFSALRTDNIDAWAKECICQS